LSRRAERAGKLARVNDADRRRRERLATAALVVALVVCACGAMAFGASSLGMGRLARVLLSPADPSNGSDATVVLAIRMPRVLLAGMVGAVLSMAGAALQGVFKNPLADPGLIGVSSGGSLGAALVIVAGAPLFALLPAWVRPMLLPLAAFGGGVVATRLVLSLATFDGHTHVGVMLLAGVAVNAFVGAALGLLSSFASDRALRDLFFWTLGSFSSAGWTAVVATALPITLAIVGLLGLARPLDAMLLGDVEAKHLGVNVARVRARIIALAALGVGASVSAVGLIGFVGLVVPHLVRLSIGPRHARLLPLSGLLGATLVIVADTLARTVAAPLELPIGVLTALVGGPSFLWLLIRERRAS
jgi:iron complex transport system permease protein